jgi:glycine cleavage system protein P-like pyridoxal-binding family
MEIQTGSRLRNFHQAKWDEEVIFELSSPGQRGIHVPEVETEISDLVGDGLSQIPASMRRAKAPALPEVGQMRVLKHYLRLSQQNLGADLNVDIGQGTCTVKYNPKINEKIAASPKAQDIHPHQDESTVQGALRVMYELDLFLREISLQPSSGSHAILTMAAMMHKYHEVRGQADKRDELITTIFSHPSDAAAAAVKGYRIVTLYPDERGMPDVEALKAAVSERTAGLFITNPEDIGIFNPRIAEFTRIVHEAGGICGYDQANANGILGITRAREADFDLCFFNLGRLPAHSPGRLRRRHLLPRLRRSALHRQGAQFLRRLSGDPEVVRLGSQYGCRRPNGNRAYSGSQQQLPAQEDHGDRRCHLPLYGRGAKDRAGAVLLGEALRGDRNRHPRRDAPLGRLRFPPLAEPPSVRGAPAFHLRHVVQEARTEPQTVKRAPHNSVVHKIDDSSLDDPEKWAVTWRAFLKKHGESSAKIRG